jgi:hypothetical protein
VRTNRELVLHLARDTGFLRRVLGVPAHVHVAERAPEAVLDHAVDDCLVAELHAAAHSVVVVRRVGHRLLPAGDDDLTIARLDRLRREHHGLEARAAHFVDGQRRDRRRNPRLEHRLPARRLTDAALNDVAHDHFFDVVECDTGTLHRGANRLRAKFGSGEGRKPAKELADRRSGGGNDDGSTKGFSHA